MKLWNSAIFPLLILSLNVHHLVNATLTPPNVTTEQTTNISIAPAVPSTVTDLPIITDSPIVTDPPIVTDLPIVTNPPKTTNPPVVVNSPTTTISPEVHTTVMTEASQNSDDSDLWNWCTIFLLVIFVFIVTSCFIFCSCITAILTSRHPRGNSNVPFHPRTPDVMSEHDFVPRGYQYSRLSETVTPTSYPAYNQPSTSNYTAPMYRRPPPNFPPYAPLAVHSLFYGHNDTWGLMSNKNKRLAITNTPEEKDCRIMEETRNGAVERNTHGACGEEMNIGQGDLPCGKHQGTLTFLAGDTEVCGLGDGDFCYKGDPPDTAV